MQPLQLIGILVIINSLACAGWLHTNSKPLGGVGLTLLIIAVVVGLALIFNERAVEITFGKVASIKASAEKAATDAVAISELRSGLQKQKDAVDLLVRDSNTAYKEIAAVKQIALEAKDQIRAINKMELSISLELTAKWKNGKPPAADTWIWLGGSTGESMRLKFIFSDKKEAPTQFMGIENLQITPLENNRMRVSYRASAASGSLVFGSPHDQITTIDNFFFDPMVLDPELLEDPTVTIHSTELNFYVNGSWAFKVKASNEQPFAVTHKDAMLGFKTPKEVSRKAD